MKPVPPRISSVLGLLSAAPTGGSSAPAAAQADSCSTSRRVVMVRSPAHSSRALATLALTAEPAVSDAGKSGTEQRCNPEQPQLLQRPAAHDECRSGAARRVNRGVGDRNADQVYQSQSQSNRNGREPLRGAGIG